MEGKRDTDRDQDLHGGFKKTMGQPDRQKGAEKIDIRAYLYIIGLGERDTTIQKNRR